MVIVLATIECSSSSASVSAFHPTTAQGNTPLSQLTPEQIHMVCEEEAHYDVGVASTPIGLTSTCLGLAWSGAFMLAAQEQHLSPGAQPSTAALQQACEDLEAACLRNPPVLGFVDPCAPAGSIALTGCDATLDQYAACVSDLEARQVTRTPPCSRLRAPAEPAPAPMDGGLPLEPLLPTCTTFWASCPPLMNKTLDPNPGL
jgi:hypothetical protein